MVIRGKGRGKGSAVLSYMLRRVNRLMKCKLKKKVSKMVGFPASSTADQKYPTLYQLLATTHIGFSLFSQNLANFEYINHSIYIES